MADFGITITQSDRTQDSVTITVVHWSNKPSGGSFANYYFDEYRYRKSGQSTDTTVRVLQNSTYSVPPNKKDNTSVITLTSCLESQFVVNLYFSNSLIQYGSTLDFYTFTVSAYVPPTIDYTAPSYNKLEGSDIGGSDLFIQWEYVENTANYRVGIGFNYLLQDTSTYAGNKESSLTYTFSIASNTQTYYSTALTETFQWKYFEGYNNPDDVTITITTTMQYKASNKATDFTVETYSFNYTLQKPFLVVFDNTDLNNNNKFKKNTNDTILCLPFPAGALSTTYNLKYIKSVPTGDSTTYELTIQDYSSAYLDSNGLANILLDNTGFTWGVNECCKVYISSISYKYYYFGNKEASASNPLITESIFTPLILNINRRVVSKTSLENTIGLSSIISGSNINYSASITGLYYYLRNAKGENLLQKGDVLTCKLYKKYDGGTYEEFYTTTTTLETSGNSVSFTKTDSLSNYRTGKNYVKALISLKQKTFDNNYLGEITAESETSFTTDFYKTPVASFSPSFYFDSNTWNFKMSNNSQSPDYTKSNVKVYLYKYSYLKPYQAENGISYIKEDVKIDTPILVGTYNYGDSNKSFKVSLLRCATSASFSFHYYDINDNINEMASDVLILNCLASEPSTDSGISFSNPSTTLYYGENVTSSDSIKKIKAGTSCNMIITAPISITYPIIMSSTDPLSKITDRIPTNLVYHIKSGANKTFSNLFTFTNYDENSDIIISPQTNTLLKSGYNNGLLLNSNGAVEYDASSCIITLKGKLFSIFRGLVAKYNPIFSNDTELKCNCYFNNIWKQDIKVAVPTIVPNKALSQPWARTNQSVQFNYNTDMPHILVSWKNPDYPNPDDGDMEYGLIDETAIQIKREFMRSGNWTVDTKFGDKIDPVWKTLSIKSESFKEYIYANEDIDPENCEDEEYDDENATIFRRYRYTIRGYNNSSTTTKEGPESVTEIVSANRIIKAASISKITAEARELTQNILVSWEVNDAEPANNTYPPTSYKLYVMSGENPNEVLLDGNIRRTSYIHLANLGVSYRYKVYPYYLCPGQPKETTSSVMLPLTLNNIKFKFPFEFSKGSNTSIVNVENRTFFLSDMDRAIVLNNNKIYKSGIKRPKFTPTVTPSTLGTTNKKLTSGRYNAYVVLLRKDTGTRSNHSNPTLFTVDSDTNRITFEVPMNSEGTVELRDVAYTIYGKKIPAADYWEVYIECLDNDSFGQPVCVGSSNILTNSLSIQDVNDEDILSVSNRRLPLKEQYSIQPACCAGEYYNNRLYILGERDYFDGVGTSILFGEHQATVNRIVPEGVVGKQIYVDGTYTGWSVEDIEYDGDNTILDIIHFDIEIDKQGWDKSDVTEETKNIVSFQTSSAKVYYSAYFFGEPDGTTFTFSPETFPPLNVLESELSSNDFSSPIALVKSRDSLFVGKRDKIISVTGGNTDDDSFILNTSITVLSNTLGILGRRTVARDDQDNVYCLSDHGLVIITTSGINLVNYIGNTKSSFRMLFDLSDIQNACAVWSPRDQYYIVFGLKFKGESSYTAGLIFDNYVQQVRPFSLPVEVTSAIVCPADNGEYQIVTADTSGSIGIFLDKTLSKDIVLDGERGFVNKSIKGNITTGVYKPTYGLTLGPNLLPGFRPALPEIDGANSSALVKPQNVTVGFDLLGRTNYFNQFNPEVDASVSFTIPMKNNIRRIAIPQKTGQALSVRVDFEVMENHIEFGSAMVEVNEETY